MKLFFWWFWTIIYRTVALRQVPEVYSLVHRVYPFGTQALPPGYHRGIPLVPRYTPLGLGYWVCMAHPEDTFYRYLRCGQNKVFFFHPILTHTHPTAYRITYIHSFLKNKTFCFGPYRYYLPYVILSRSDGYLVLGTNHKRCAMGSLSLLSGPPQAYPFGATQGLPRTG